MAETSRKLTTFITPYGRYCFNKLPFGMSSAPEQFQKRMTVMLADLQGVRCSIDDVLVFGKNQEEHDVRLRAVMERLQKHGVTLNKEKCEFSKNKIIFLGHQIDERGIQADPTKTQAIAQMKAPTTVSELRRVLGMVNQLGKFSPHLAHLIQPLRELLSKKATWYWDSIHQQAFQNIKTELVKPTILAMYDPAAPTKIAADASSYGLGAVLLQKEEDKWRPVGYASRAMTETETRYAQIEKEALASTWACEKFAEYIIGIKFQIETDHKPLVSLLGNKALDMLPPRILRFRLRLSRFDYTITHVPGKLLNVADTLSRAPIESEVDKECEEEVEAVMEVCILQLPATSSRLNVYATAQQEDSVCSRVREFCQQGWPEKRYSSFHIGKREQNYQLAITYCCTEDEL